MAEKGEDCGEIVVRLWWDCGEIVVRLTILSFLEGCSLLRRLSSFVAASHQD